MINTIGLYQIKCLATGTIYIGSTNNITRRLREHRAALRSGNHCNRHLQFAFNKHGEEAFEFSILAELPNISESHLRKLEMETILKASLAGTVYNYGEMSPTNSWGRKQPDHIKEAIRASKRGKPRPDLRGVPRSPKIRKSIHDGWAKHLRQIEATSVETGRIIQFESLREAEQQGFARVCIRRCCNGMGQQVHKGFTWRWM